MNVHFRFVFNINENSEFLFGDFISLIIIKIDVGYIVCLIELYFKKTKNRQRNTPCITKVFVKMCLKQ